MFWGRACYQRMLSTDGTQRKLTNNNVCKSGARPVLVGCSLGQKRDIHEINTNQPKIVSLGLGFDLAVVVYDVDWGDKPFIGLLFTTVGRRPVQFALWMSYFPLFRNAHLLPIKKRRCHLSPQK